MKIECTFKVERCEFDIDGGVSRHTIRMSGQVYPLGAIPLPTEKGPTFHVEAVVEPELASLIETAVNQAFEEGVTRRERVTLAIERARSEVQNDMD